MNRSLEGLITMNNGVVAVHHARDSLAKGFASSEAEIDAEVIRLQAEWDAQTYARNRKTEYDALNQFELISDDTINGTTTHKDAIVAIKTKYPKG